MDRLKTPDKEALQHSAMLATLIRKAISESPDAALPYSRFVNMALYTPGLGYYSAGASKLGADGDFVTAPEIGPIFSQTVAAVFIPRMRQLGSRARLLEIGAGSGAFACTVLKVLQAHQVLPASYAILETSADLRARQYATLQASLCPEVFERVEWLDQPFTDSWVGLLFANEVVDALPATRFMARDGLFYEEMVSVSQDGNFVPRFLAANDQLSVQLRQLEETIGRQFSNGYCSECLPQLPSWLKAVSAGLEQGLLIFIDYGHARREYYQPDRWQGTRRAYYRHQVHRDPYRWPGLQDITASVDFTALAEAGCQAGFLLEGYSTLSQFLLHHGIDQWLGEAKSRTDRQDPFAEQRVSAQARQLLFPDQMGESFQVMAFSRNFDQESLFPCPDLSWRL